MSYKIFVAATLLSLTFVGCNANLSTGHPNAKTPSANNQQKTSLGGTATNAAKAASTATPTAAGQVGVIDSEVAGFYSCDKNNSKDHCDDNEKIQVSNDLKTVLLTWTAYVDGTSTTCDQQQVMHLDLTTVKVADDGTSTSGNTSTVTATLDKVIVGTKDQNNADCTKAIATLKAPTATRTMTFQTMTSKVANDMLHVTFNSKDVDLVFDRDAADDSETPSSASAPTTTIAPLNSVAPAAAPQADGAQPVAQPVAGQQSSGGQQPQQQRPEAPATEAEAAAQTPTN